MTGYNYFDSISDSQNGYMAKAPKKADVLNNAKIEGRATILPNSNNRALIINDGKKLYLQSYDALVLSVDLSTGDVIKLWNDYSLTTLKHVNNFLLGFGLTFSKKTWLNFNGCTIDKQRKRRAF